MRRSIIRAFVGLVLLTGGCGSLDSTDDGTSASTVETTDATTSPDAATTDEADEAGSADDPDEAAGTEATDDLDEAALCAALSQDDIDPTVVELAPDRYRTALQSFVDMPDAMDGEDLQPMIDAADANPTMGVDLRALLDEIECDTQTELEVGAIADMFALYEPEPDDAYCAVLSEAFADQTEGLTPDDSEVLPEHAAAWNRLRLLGDSGDDLDLPEDEAWRLFGDLAGLGMYAEGRCGQPGVFAQTMFGAAFMLAAATGEFGGDGGELEVLPADNPPEVDPEANGDTIVSRSPLDDAESARLLELAGGNSSITGFERLVLDLDAEDDPGRYLAEVIVPVAWELEDTFFGVGFEPVDGGFFTELSFDVACQGLCGPADDWPERFASFFEESGAEILADEPLTGPEGRLVVTGGSITTDVIAGRWSADAGRLLQCQAELDDEDVALVPLFSEICRLAVARWL